MPTLSPDYSFSAELLHAQGAYRHLEEGSACSSGRNRALLHTDPHWKAVGGRSPCSSLARIIVAGNHYLCE